MNFTTLDQYDYHILDYECDNNIVTNSTVTQIQVVIHLDSRNDPVAADISGSLTASDGACYVEGFHFKARELRVIPDNPLDANSSYSMIIKGDNNDGL